MNCILKRTFTGLGLALGLLAATNPVQAGFTVVFEGTVDPGISPAGQYNWHADPHINGLVYDPLPGNPNHFGSFCIQTNQFIGGGSYTYDFVSLESAPIGGTGTATITPTNADNIRLMWATYRNTLGTDADMNAAFQYAIWNFANQTPPVPLSSMSLNVQNLFGTYTTFANWGSTMANLAAMVSGNNQDQVVELDTGGTPGNLSIVPAPPAVILALAGILPCFALRRRLRGKAI